MRADGNEIHDENCTRFEVKFVAESVCALKSIRCEKYKDGLKLPYGDKRAGSLKGNPQRRARVERSF